MEKFDFNKQVQDEAARLAAGGGQQPSMEGKSHVVYYIGGPMDLCKQAAPADPGDVIQVPMLQPTKMTDANGQPLNQQVAIGLYKRVVFFMSPTQVFHVVTLSEIRPL